MTTSLRLRQLEVAAHLEARDIPATTDPAHVLANLPIVLVAPPELSGARLGGGWGSATWRLLVIGGQVGTLAAVEATWDLLEALQDALPITDARPGSYQLGQDLVLCYVATFPDNTADWPPATP
jgi:hypothetical protein